MALTKATQNVLEGIVSTGSTGVSAGSFVVAQQYKITSLGNTTQLQWNTIAGTTGQTYVVGSLFTAATTGSGSGTGAAAVARTLANRFADVVNVKDFGAVGDGVADDTDAIQAAFNFVPASGGEVIIPKGTYILSSTLNISNKPISIFGAGIGISILKWTGVGMVGQNGINYTNTAQQSFTMQDLTFKAFPNPSNIYDNCGTAISVIYPELETTSEISIKFSKLEIRPETSLPPVNWPRGGWTKNIYLRDAGRMSISDSNFYGTRKANQIGVHVDCKVATILSSIHHCTFNGFDDGILVTKIPSPFGGPGQLIFESSDFTGCRKGITIDTFGDLAQISNNYFQCFEHGIYCKVRTAFIYGNRVDGVDDPLSIRPPVAAIFGIKLTVPNVGFLSDDAIIQNNQFGNFYTLGQMDGIVLDGGYIHNIVSENIFGYGLPSPTGGFPLRYGIYIAPGSTNNLITNNKAAKVNCLVLDASNYTTVINNSVFQSEQPMPITGNWPVLASGNSNITLNTSVILTQPSPTNVTELFNGYSGQVLTIIAGDSRSTIISSTVTVNTIALPGGNWNMPLGSTLTILHTGSYWKEIGRTL